MYLRKVFPTSFLLLIFILQISCARDEDLSSLILQENIIEEEINSSEPSNTENGEDSRDEENQEDNNNEVVDDPVSSTLKAFPSAFGAGSYASGGRGGRVINVTTIEDTGSEGSLRWAFGQQGPRIIIFKVGGNFNLTRGRLKLGPLNNNLTVAGQTAPGDGVTISGDYLQMSEVDNVILRYIRFRGIENGSFQKDLITGIDCTNIILDHCSGSWGRDEIWSFTSSRTVSGRITTDNITIQRSLMAEMDPEHSTGSLFGTVSNELRENSGDFSWNNNYAYNISHRFPNVLGEGHFEIKNNVIYNWAYRLTSAYYGAEVNQQNNYYKMGPRTIAHGLGEENDILGTLNRVGNTGIPPMIYAKGNLVMPDIITDPETDNLIMWRWFQNSNGRSRNNVVPKDLVISSEPENLGSSFPLISASDAYFSVLEDVGANKSLNEDGSYIINQDELDLSYINACVNDLGTSSYRSVGEWILPKLDNPGNSNGYVDSDNDGMPDLWEIAKGLNPNSDDSSGDIDGDGYTNIEDFINLVDF